MTKTFDAGNERLKRSYLVYMREAQRHGEASLDAINKALHRFETYTRFRPFKAFRREQAIGFKHHLAGQNNLRSGEPLTVATQHSTMAALRGFFHWLAGQPGYRRAINASDADYFSLSRGDTRIARTRREQPVASLDQVSMTIAGMPAGTATERRDRALLAFTIATGARDGAIITLKLKHVDLLARRVTFDARDVHTKFSKTFTTWFFPVGDEIIAIIADWIMYLVEVEGWQPNDPLFPRTRVVSDGEARFQSAGLDRAPWATATPIRAIFKQAFARADLPYFAPHSFRKTLARLGQGMCIGAEAYKAWSQNLGHESVLTTFSSYGAVAPDRQADIIRQLAVRPPEPADPIQAIAREAAAHAIQLYRKQPNDPLAEDSGTNPPGVAGLQRLPAS